MTSQDLSLLTKACKQCYKVKPVNAFAKKRNGHDTRCKSCKSQKRREMYRERFRKRRKQPLEITRVIEVRAKDCPDLQDRLRAIESILMGMALDMLVETA